jgi:hypothetical protein
VGGWYIGVVGCSPFCGFSAFLSFDLMYQLKFHIFYFESDKKLPKQPFFVFQTQQRLVVGQLS